MATGPLNGRRNKTMEPKRGAIWSPPWSQVPYFLQEGQGIIDGVEHVRGELERQWGVGRLRLIVSQELRSRFDRQASMFQSAIDRGTIEDVREQGRRMINAWRALNRVAVDAGEPVLHPLVWEVQLGDGRVVALVRTQAEARHVRQSGRQIELWTLDEVARLIVAFPTIVKAKELWPGAEVVSARMHVPEMPLDGDPVPQFGGG